MQLLPQAVNTAVTLETSQELLRRLLVLVAECPVEDGSENLCPEGTGLYAASRSVSKYLQPHAWEIEYVSPAQIELSTQSISQQLPAGDRSKPSSQREVDV